MEHKAATGFEWKALGEGQFRATIATFNEIDSDGDVTLPGAFPNGKEVRISAWGHSSWGGILPVGKGVIRSDNQRAYVDGQFFLDTSIGRDTYTTVKNLGDLQEWSYGFRPMKHSFGRFQDTDVRFLEEVDPYEASPVLLGAGVGTRTELIKALQRDAPSVHTAIAEWQALLWEVKRGARLSRATRASLESMMDQLRQLLADAEDEADDDENANAAADADSKGQGDEAPPIPAPDVQLPPEKRALQSIFRNLTHHESAMRFRMGK